MKSRLLLSIATVITGCTTTTPCMVVRYAPPTPRVSSPTPAAPTSTPTPGQPCALATFAPTQTRVYPPRTPGTRGLGQTSGAVRALTTTPWDEQVQGIAVDAEGMRGAVVLRNARDGQWYAAMLGDGGLVTLGAGERATLAYGPDEVATVVQVGDVVQVRRAVTLVELRTATRSVPLNVLGADLHAGYGPEGWLYVAQGGVLSRLNPFANAWEWQGLYDGEAQQIVRAEDILLVQTSAGVWRGVTEGRLVQTWAGAATGLAVQDMRAAITWREGNAWYRAESTDAGATWWNTERVAGDLPGTLGTPYPLIAADGTQEVVGLYTPPSDGGRAAFAVPIVVQWTPDGWYPALGAWPEPLVKLTADLLPAEALRAVSVQGLSLVTWEGVDVSGVRDVLVVTR